MRSLHEQKGVGFTSIIFILLGLSIIGLLGVKLFPMYIDNMTIAEVVRSTAADPKTKNMSTRELKNALGTRLTINGLYEYRETAKFTKDGGIIYVELNYERRDTLWGNIELLVTFENKAEVSSHKD